MSQADIIPLLLLAILGLALGIGFLMLGWMLAVHRRQRLDRLITTPVLNFFPFPTMSPQRPSCWLAIRSASTEAVKEALGLNRAAPCSWEEGLAGGHEFFISQRVHGWVPTCAQCLPGVQCG